MISLASPSLRSHVTGIGGCGWHGAVVASLEADFDVDGRYRFIDINEPPRRQGRQEKREEKRKDEARKASMSSQ